jgi:hypothetical protein
MRARGFVALVTLLLLTAGRAVDIGTTLHFDPSLHREANPLVLLFGGGIGTLIASNVLIWLLFLVALFAFWRGPTLKLSRPSENFAEFFRTWVRQVVGSRRPISHTLPGGSHWNEGLQAIRLFGLGLSWAMILGSMLAAHAWFATRDARGTLFQQAYATFHFGKLSVLIYLIMPIGFVMGGTIFFLCEYNCAPFRPLGNDRDSCK